jgi:hypothetical protein
VETDVFVVVQSHDGDEWDYPIRHAEFFPLMSMWLSWDLSVKKTGLGGIIPKYWLEEFGELRHRWWIEGRNI